MFVQCKLWVGEHTSTKPSRIDKLMLSSRIASEKDMMLMYLSTLLSYRFPCFIFDVMESKLYRTRASCLKLAMTLVNVSLKF